MALADADVFLDLHDYFGDDFDARRTKLYATTNVPGEAIFDTATGETRVGSGRATIADDGTGMITVWVPGASNPVTWQTSIHLDYPDPGTRSRKIRTFGPFTITGDVTLSGLVEEQEVPPEYLTTVTTLLDGYVTEAEAAVTEAEAARDDAEDAVIAAAAAAAEAEAAADLAVDISGIAVIDDAVAVLVEDGGSDTAGALALGYVARTAINTGETFTFSFDGTANPGDGCVGPHLNKSGTDDHPLAFTWSVDDVPYHAIAMDYENNEFVLYGCAALHPTNNEGYIDRLRIDPNSYRMVWGPNVGYVYGALSNFEVLGTDPFPIRVQRFGTDHPSGGLAADVYGELSGLQITQYEIGQRRTFVDFCGDAPIGFQVGSDALVDDTNNFFIYDKEAGMARLIIEADGDFDIQGNVIKTGKIWAAGNGVDSNNTALHLENTAGGGRYYGISSGIPGVGQAGLCIFDWTATAARMVVTAGGDVVIGNGAAIATTATDGFLSLPSMAGTPTGAPTGYGAAIPMVIDTTGSKLWARIGGTWKSVTLA